MNLILPEIVSIGIYNSQIVAKNIFITKKRTATMFEIEIPIENGGVSHINSDATEIVPDMVICAKPGQKRYSKLPYKCYYIHMILEDGVLYNTLMNIPDFVKITRTEKYIEVFKKLCKYYDSALEDNDIIVHSLCIC